MIGLVIVSHGQFASELISAAEHVIGPQPGIKAICIGPDDDMEERREDIKTAVEEAGGETGAIILTDMFGGTPSNLAISIMENAKIEVIAGINLPMLIKLATIRSEMPVEQAILSAQEAGQKYISIASQVLGEK